MGGHDHGACFGFVTDGRKKTVLVAAPEMVARLGDSGGDEVVIIGGSGRSRSFGTAFWVPLVEMWLESTATIINTI